MAKPDVDGLAVPANEQRVLAELPGAALRLAVDREGIVLEAILAESEAWGGWRPRVGESVQVATESLSPSFGIQLNAALFHQRPHTWVFLAHIGDRVVPCRASFQASVWGAECTLQLELLAGEEARVSVIDHAASLERVAVVAQSVLAELNSDGALRNRTTRVLPILLASLGVDAGAVFVVRDELRAEFVAAYGPTRQRGHPYDALDLTDQRLGSSGRYAQWIYLESGDEVQPALRAVLRRGYGMGVVVPACAGNAAAAYVVVSGQRRRPFDFYETILLSTVCDGLGPMARGDALSGESLRNAALLQSSQAVFRAISQSLDLEQTFSEIAVNAAQVVTGSACLLLELQQEVDALVVVACSHSGANGLIGTRVQFGGGLEISDQLKSRRSLVVDDVIPSASLESDVLRLSGLGSVLLVPLNVRAELIGCLMLYASGKRRGYSEADMARAEGVAEQAATAIYNARLYRDLVRSRERVRMLMRRVSEIRQSERKAFSSVIHDDIVQAVVGAVYLLDGFRRTAGGSSTIDDAIEVLRETIADARRLIWELRPPVLEELGLEAALRALTEHVDAGESRSPQIVCDIQEIPALPPETATTIYKIAREAALNAFRHAHAKHISIGLSVDETGEGSTIRLVVEDDGVGFCVAETESESHFGQTMMEEQATIVGGRVDVHSVPGSGTRVVVVAPLSDGLFASYEEERP